jgi:hypothetical protein
MGVTDIITMRSCCFEGLCKARENETERRFNAGNACYRAEQKSLSSSLLPNKTGNVRINVTLMHVDVTIVVEKQ